MSDELGDHVVDIQVHSWKKWEVEAHSEGVKTVDEGMWFICRLIVRS
jgi:hypothetical protein